MAKADGVDRDINLVQQPSTIEAMRTEIVQATKNEIKGEIMCLEVLYPDHDQLHNDARIENNPLIALKASTDPDTMYLHEAMRELDWK